MARSLLFISFCCINSVGAIAQEKDEPTAPETNRPNILLILADDLGFSDLGCYGGEIQTPNLDTLAARGVRFSQFYNTARCWPTRSALLTGYYAQQIRRDILPGVPSGGRGQRQSWAKLIPDYLHPAGYRSYHSGKWHLDGMPIANGFDRSYYLRDQGRFFNPQVHYEDDIKLPPVKLGSGYYATTAIGNHAVKCLRDHQTNYADEPFFHFLAFTAPHFPLHALPEDIAKYREVYRQGWDAIRNQRWKRMQSSGLLDGNISDVEFDLGPPYDFPDHLDILGDDEVNRPVPWERLTESQKEFQADKMAIHAAMIDRMDVMIGKVLDQVRDMGQLDNTLVFFLSDNGSSAEIMVRSDGHDPKADRGSAASYLCLGPGWSTVGNTPLRRHKTWTHEGGCATPFIVSWPAKIKDHGSFRRQVGHVIDLVPTIAEVSGLTLPPLHDGKPYPRRPGKNLANALVENARIQRDYLWWFHDGHKALRVGDFKVVSSKGEPWELYDLSTDRAESKDLAASMQEKTTELTRRWDNVASQFLKIAQMGLPAQKPTKAKSASAK